MTNQQWLGRLSVDEIILEVVPKSGYSCPLENLDPSRAETDKCTECHECISAWLEEEAR